MTAQPPADFQQRLDRLESYLRQDPGNGALLAESVAAALEWAHPDRAAAFLAISTLPEGNAQHLHLQGLVALAQHRFADAAALFSAVIRAGVDAPAVHYNRAYALFRDGQAAAAATGFEALLAADEAPPQLLAYLVRARHHAGDLQGAIAAWENAPTRLRLPEAAAAASLACLDAGRLDQAKSLADQALRDAVPAIEALVVRASLAVGEGDARLAQQVLQPALRRAPEDGRVWSALGAALLLEGNTADAEQAFVRSVQFLPAHQGAWLTLAWCRILRRDLAGARASLSTAMEIDRNFAEVHGTLAVVSALEGDREAARQAIDRAQGLDPASLSARYAEAVLDGSAADATSMQTLARRLLSDRTGSQGTALLERALRLGGK